MFFIYISNFHSSWYLSAPFQSNVGCSSAGPPDLGTACTGLTLLTRVICFSYSHDSSYGSFNCCLHYCLCHTIVFALVLWGCLVLVCLYLLFLNLPCVRLLPFYFWHHWYLLCHLFYMLNVIIAPVLYVNKCIYIQLYVQMALLWMCPCLLLVGMCMMCHLLVIIHLWYASMWILHNYCQCSHPYDITTDIVTIWNLCHVSCAMSPLPFWLIKAWYTDEHVCEIQSL